MELRQLRYFRTIADARSFVRGAEHLNVAQPALSRSIARLEEEIGQLLFIRHNGGVTLTDAGARLYEHACNVLHRVQMLRDDMAGEMGAPHGVAALGMPASLQTVLAAPIAAAFLKAFPRVTLNVVLNTSINLRDALTASLIDVALISSATPSRGLRYTPVFTESACLVQKSSGSPRFGAEIELADLIDVPLVLCGYPNSMRLLLEDALAKLGARPDLRCEVNTASLALDLVAEGAGACLVPSCAVVGRDLEGLRVTRVRGLECGWSIATSFDRVGSASVARLSEMILDQVSQLIDSGEWPEARFDGDSGVGPAAMLAEDLAEAIAPAVH